MKVNKGTKYKKIKEVEKKSIVDVECKNYKLFVFEGTLSQNDILIKYQEENKNVRTPAHVHWVVDLLMKRQANEELTKEFIKTLQKVWNESKPLKANDYDSIVQVLDSGIKDYNIVSFEELNEYGEYNIDFLFVLLQLLIVQEKTNRSDTYLTGKIIDKMLNDELDIFAILSTAIFRGK